MKKNWFLRFSRWEWSPIIVGIAICFITLAISPAAAAEAAPVGIGLVLFAWFAMVRYFVK